MELNDAHCHFFSTRFFNTLTHDSDRFPGEGCERAGKVTDLLEWEAPGSDEDLADRWVRELDDNSVSRAALIASVPGDEDSVAAAVRRHPRRFVGFFMVDPRSPDAAWRVESALREKGMRCLCLFPAMQGFRIGDEPALGVIRAASSVPGAAVFVHCGVLSVGVRRKLGLASRFDIACGNPLDLHAVALRFPDLPFIIPHFGAGFLREALMVADLCPNIHFDTSSSNSWVRYIAGMTLEKAFEQALQVLGPERLLFGSDSSYFPRGWNRPIWRLQREAIEPLLSVDERVQVFGGNFNRLFPA